MYLNTTLCKGQVDLNWPLRGGLLGTLGCSSVGDDSHENASSLGCCARGGFGESIWDEGVWWRWGERCVALIQVRKNQGWRYHWSIKKLCNGNEHVKCREFHLPLAILAGHSPWHHGWPEVMRWNSIWSKRRPQKRHWRSIGKLPPQLCFVAYGKKGIIYQQNAIFVGKPHLKKRPVMVAGYFAPSIPCSSIIPETCSPFYCESSLTGGLL